MEHHLNKSFIFTLKIRFAKKCRLAEKKVKGINNFKILSIIPKFNDDGYE